MIVVGELSLWIALLVACWSTVVSFAGGAGAEYSPLAVSLRVV